MSTNSVTPNIAASDFFPEIDAKSAPPEPCAEVSNSARKYTHQYTRFDLSNLTNLPVELSAYDSWIDWREDPPLKPTAKPRKRPIAPRTGIPCDHTDPQYHTSRDVAVAAYNKNKTLAGIGFELSESNPYAGIDLDKCRDPKTGQIALWATELIEQFDSYSEISPSETGIKILVRGSLVGKECHFTFQGHEIEVYDSGRYFALTGRRLPDAPTEIQERQAQIDLLVPDELPYIEPSGPRIPRAEDEAAQAVDAVPDEELIARIERSAQGKKFKQLMAGSRAGYPGYFASSGALCAILAGWTRCNTERIDRIYRQSGLFEKSWWDERCYSGQRSRAEVTIAASCRLAAGGWMYDPRPKPETFSESGTSPTEPRLFQFAQKPSELSTKPIDWVIEGMYPRKSLSILCGREGIGKGVNTLMSIAAILKGGLFLGHKTNPVCHVLLVDMENPEAVVRDRLVKLGLLDDQNLRVWGQWNVVPPPTRFNDPMYREYAQKVGGFIFFDSLIDFCNGANENDAAEMNEALTEARLLARHCDGVHIQHHSDKYGKSGWRGTTAITAAVDMAFGIRAVDDDSFRQGTNREVCFSTLKPKMCAPYHLNYEIVGWNGQLAYRLMSPSKSANFQPTTTMSEKKPTKFESALRIGQEFIQSKLERKQPVSVGDVKKELEKNAFEQRPVRDVVKTLRAQFKTQEDKSGQDRTVFFINPPDIESPNAGETADIFDPLRDAK